MAVLLLLIPTSLIRLVGAGKPVLYHTYRLQRLFHAQVRDLLGLLLAVLGVVVLLSLLGTSLHLQLDRLLHQLHSLPLPDRSLVTDLPDLLLAVLGVVVLLSRLGSSLHLQLDDLLRPKAAFLLGWYLTQVS